MVTVKSDMAKKLRRKCLLFVFVFRVPHVRLASLAAGQKSGLPEQAHKVYHYYLS